ncbi:MAG: Trk system potassium transporter TrkA [bacterium]|nr:Trk system potassium transporter TrkA [bacterium]
MKIVIAGAGAVGTHLAQLLSKDNLSVVLIDHDENILGKLNNELDIMTCAVSATSIDGLKKAGVENADLFIAVTSHESKNITSALLARQLGARRTVARVDNYEYMKPENRIFFEKAGIDALIYPDLLAAKEIADSAQYSWARQMWKFGVEGNLLLLNVKMGFQENGQESNQLLGYTLREIGMRHGHSFHVVAIRRNNETVMPHGEVRILPHDIVFFMTTRDEVSTLRHLLGKDNYPQVKRAFIIGGGKLSVGADWALPEAMDLKILEADETRCEELGRLTRNRTLVIHGEAHDMELLNDEGYGQHLEAFIALTPNDEKNILACVAAHRKGVPKTIAQVENLDYLGMAETLDVGTVINKKAIAASYIYQMLLKSSVDNMKILNVADAEVAEFVVRKGSLVTRYPVMETGLPRGVNIGGMVRNGKGCLVGGQTVLQEGDRVVLFCIGGTLKKIDKYFK